MKPAAPIAASLALTLALALAACSGSKEEPAPQPSGGTAPTPAEPAATAAPPPSSPQVAQAIPAAFQGVWDSDEGNCVVTSITRMEIAPQQVNFYESRGDVTRVEIDTPDRIVVSLAMEGEGQQWRMARMFTLDEGGTRMTPSSVDAEEPLAPVSLKKCTT